MSDGEFVEEGWAWPGLARKAHYFREGRSLCNRWAYFGKIRASEQTLSRSPDDCVACARRAP